MRLTVYIAVNLIYTVTNQCRLKTSLPNMPGFGVFA